MRPSFILSGSRYRAFVRLVTFAATGLVLVLPAYAQRPVNPAGKIYFAEAGDVTIARGGHVDDVTRAGVFMAEGSVIETVADKNADAQTGSIVVYSNGSAAFLGQGTKLEIKRFAQEPFKPSRSDVGAEPSVSVTHAYLQRGTVALSINQQATGSQMVYETPFGTVIVRGRKVVIESDQNGMKVAVLDGECVIKGGEFDLGGHIVRSGEQLFIATGGAGGRSVGQTTVIPPPELVRFTALLAQTSLAQRSVYFDVKQKAGPPNIGQNGTDAVAAGADSTATTTDAASSVFSARSPNGDTSSVEIIAVKVVPVSAPVELTLSASRSN